MPAAGQRKSKPRPGWSLVAGLAIGTLTLLFLMSFPLISVLTGKRIECGDTFWVTLIFALALGLSSAFLGGWATARGNVILPLLGNNPLTIAAAGGIVFVVIGAAISYLVISHSCVNPEVVRLSFSNWDYQPNYRKLTFRLEKEIVKLSNYIPASAADQYNAYVAIRQSGAVSPGRGTYPILKGPFHMGPTGDLEVLLTSEQVQLLGPGCVEFLVFGLKKNGESQADLAAPFQPADHPETTLFRIVGLKGPSCEQQS